jgi:Zn-dependent protease with chaperone function
LRSEAFRDIRSVWCCLWYALYVFFGTIATLSALGGTLMQLLGVYSADICYLTVDKWMHPYERGITAMISTNSRKMIRDAQTYWKPCAITAIAFMTFVSFVGWWYQRRMKDVFTTLVSEVDLEEHDRRDTRDSRSRGLELGG